MNDISFITGLMKTERDALGFITRSIIQERYIAYGRYIMIRERLGPRRGYLLHGPANPPNPLYVHQLCIDSDHRLRGFATVAIDALIQHAENAGCPSIRLQCATHLSANAFWLAMGFELISITGGLHRTKRPTSNYAYFLRKSCDRRPTPRKLKIPGLLGVR